MDLHPRHRLVARPASLVAPPARPAAAGGRPVRGVAAGHGRRVRRPAGVGDPRDRTAADARWRARRRAGALAAEGGRPPAPPRRPGPAGRLGQGLRRRHLRPLVAVAGRRPRPSRADDPDRPALRRLAAAGSGPTWPATRRTTSSTSFARGLGIPERGFDRDHYDVPSEWYDDVVAAGAVPVTSRELIVRAGDGRAAAAQALTARAGGLMRGRDDNGPEQRPVAAQGLVGRSRSRRPIPMLCWRSGRRSWTCRSGARSTSRVARSTSARAWALSRVQKAEVYEPPVWPPEPGTSGDAAAPRGRGLRPRGRGRARASSSARPWRRTSRRTTYGCCSTPPGIPSASTPEPRG